MELILKEHGDVLHAWSDVKVFSDGNGWCLKCKTDHCIDAETCGIDLLITGPSCKNLSRLSNVRKKFVGHYSLPAEEQIGESGYTYQHGFRKVP